MIPKQQTGQKIFSITTRRGWRRGLERHRCLDNKTFFGFSPRYRRFIGSIFRALALAGSIFTGASRSIVLRTKRERESERFSMADGAFFFPPREKHSLTL